MAANAYAVDSSGAVDTHTHLLYQESARSNGDNRASRKILMAYDTTPRIPRWQHHNIANARQSSS